MNVLHLSRIGYRALALTMAGVMLSVTSVASAPAAVNSRAVTTVSTVTSTCGVIPSTQLRVLSASEPCIVVVGVRGSFRLSLPTGFRWGAVSATSGVAKVTGGPGPATGGLRVSVTGVRTGRTTLSSTGTIVCPPGVACPALARLWSLVVLVSASPTAPVSLLVTTSDSGRQITLRPGDHLNLNLIGPAIYSWTKAVASNSAVLNRLSVTGGESVARAVFVARGSGRSTVSAVDNPRCYPQCLAPSRLFHVGVVVSR